MRQTSFLQTWRQALTAFKTYLAPHKQQSAAPDIPDVEETAGVLISLLDCWRSPNKSPRSFRSQLLAVPAARCGSLRSALAEEFLVAWFYKAMHVSGLFLTVMGLNHMLSFTLANNRSQEVESYRRGSTCQWYRKRKKPSLSILFQFQGTVQNLRGGGIPTSTEGRD